MARMGRPGLVPTVRMGLGLRIARQRVARQMCAGSLGISIRGKHRHSPNATAHDDLEKHQFTAEGPDRV